MKQKQTEKTNKTCITAAINTIKKINHAINVIKEINRLTALVPSNK